ncbi:aldo/keto reductase [Paenibacillus sp. LHD-38]|uniref:aldo/keto reductase n=1 Tax=Paenibacillus sp. LHD-38 TaxID=3072143 RepID=UPI0028108A84|nr:aldo/keto reductase [Paenibacillus sp. LHD-38]MDQ8733552.1 aldo/keto reductase [Paenibacillus sp. LHD-38]
MNGFPEVGTNERNVLDSIGAKYGKTAYQVALNWLLRQEGIVTIPKAVNKEHIVDNLNALGWDLQQEDLDLIESNFAIDNNGLN